MNDTARIISDFNVGRDPERLAIKYHNMRADPFVFLRGTCHLFYQHLPSLEILRNAPIIWQCGDLHLQNFGSYKDSQRDVYFDINDFDEAALAPCTWDLVRFLTSLRLGLSTMRLSDKDIGDIGMRYLEVYGQTVTDNSPAAIDQNNATGLIRNLLQDVAQRSRPKFLDSRTEKIANARKLKVDGKKALPLTEDDRRRVHALLKNFAGATDKPEFFEILDIARRIAGTGSLGVERYVVLVTGKGSPDGNYLLDLKEARPSSLPAHGQARSALWPSEAERIVQLQSTLQHAPVAFLEPISFGDHSYIIRGLLPSEDRVALAASAGKIKRLQKVIQTMARLTAWAHLRGCSRFGAAPTEELLSFVRGSDWPAQLRKATRLCTAQTIDDWHVYGTAYDSGFFERRNVV